MSDPNEMALQPSTHEEFIVALETLVRSSVQNGLDVRSGYTVWDDDTESTGYEVEITRVDRR